MQGVQGRGGTPRQKKEQGQRHCDSMGQSVFRKVQVVFYGMRSWKGARTH